MPTVSKRFSNVRYWRYVFTPMLFVILLFGIFLLYAGEKASYASFPSLVGVLRRNINSNSSNNSLGAVFSEMNKLASR